MSWEVIFVVGLLTLTVISFVREKIPTELTALIAYCVLLLGSQLPFPNTLPKLGELMEVFANPGTLAIAAMFILSAALEKSGAIEGLSRMLAGLAKYGYWVVVSAMMLLVGFISAWMNNTPVVVIFMPVVLSLARKSGIPASRLLIPLSYSSVLGGMCTLVGTSTNIVGSTVLQRLGFEPLHMFEFTWLGVPMLLVGVVYVALLGQKLLPERASLTAILSEEERKEYFAEAFVRAGSPLVGKSAQEAGLLKGRGIRVMEIIRDEVALKGDLKTQPLEAGDRLVLSCRPSGFVHATQIGGLQLAGEAGQGLETIAAHEGTIVEGVIGPRSALVGKTIRELNFRQRFRMVLLAIHRHGVNMRESIDSLTFEPGDTLLMMGTDQAREQIRRSDDILLLDRPPTPMQNYRRKAPIVLAAFAAIVLVSSFELMPIHAAAIIGVAVVLITGCIQPKDAYASIDWSILLLIVCMLGIGQAMETTGADALLAKSLLHLSHLGFSPQVSYVITLAVIGFVTVLMTEFLSNNACAVLMIPIAVEVGNAMGVDPRGLAMMVVVCSSIGFATPIGYQTNTYVYSVGGYRFKDFIIFGVPLNILCWMICCVAIPMVWPAY